MSKTSKRDNYIRVVVDKATIEIGEAKKLRGLFIGLVTSALFSIYFVTVTLHVYLLWGSHLLTVRTIFVVSVEVFDIKGNYGNFQMHLPCSETHRL